MSNECPNVVEIENVVQELNEALGYLYEEGAANFSFSSNSHTYLINFQGADIWCSEVDDREYLDEEGTKEDLKTFILQKTRTLCINVVSRTSLALTKTLCNS